MTVNVIEIADRLATRGEVRLAGLRHLRGACDEAGLTREGAEALARLDAALGGDEAYAELLCELVVDAVVHGERPTGRVTEEAAVWLAGVFGHGACPSGGRVLREVVRAAQAVPAALVEAAFGGSKLAAAGRAYA